MPKPPAWILDAEIRKVAAVDIIAPDGEFIAAAGEILDQNTYLYLADNFDGNFYIPKLFDVYIKKGEAQCKSEN